ncbi:MAG: hypothetical protein M3384_06195 [Acidobacteriota bacterium]|nr:hypothetical protein [Acidobacteriota bacterium]
MKKLLATFMLMMCVFVFVGTTAASIYDPGTNRCHDASGKFVSGPNCDPNSCGCLFHEAYEYIKSFF